MTHEPTQVTTDEPSGRATSRRLGRWLTGAVAGLALCAVLIGGTALAQTDGAGSGLQQAFLERLAERLGITTAELQTAMTEAGNAAVDDAVASGDLTQEQGDAMKERIAGDDDFSGFGRGHRWHGPGGPGHAVHLDTIATTLGMTTDELRAELEAGTTLTDIIAAQSQTVDAVVDALVAEKQAMLDEKVAEGHITQAEADAILADLPARLTEMIESNTFRFGGHHHHWLDGDSSTDNSTDATPTT
jgi:polyhydroxyalkanoate synthesis regulator phasin